MNEQDKITQTLREMFEQREYEIISEEDNMLIAVKPDGKEVCTFLEVVPKFNVKSFQTYVVNLHHQEIAHGIIVYEKMTPAVKKLLRNTTELKMLMETFQKSELQCNITKHRLVPSHRKISVDELVEIKKKGIDPIKLPVLKMSDPVARFFAFRRGNVIEVKRRNGFVAYRVVR